MKNRALPRIAILTASLLVLAACGGSSGDDEPTTESSPAAEAEAQAGSEQPVGSAEDGIADEAVEVGEEFTVPDTSASGDDAEYNGGELTVTYDGFLWLEEDEIEGDTQNYGVALLSVRNDSDAPVNLFAPIDGGSWYYTAEDGQVQTVLNLGQQWSTTFSGILTPWHAGPHLPGEGQPELTVDAPFPERSGTLSYRTPMGEIWAALEVPGESDVPDDSEAVATIEQRAQLFDGVVATGPEAPPAEDSGSEDSSAGGYDFDSQFEDCDAANSYWGGIMNDELAGMEIDEDELAALEEWMQENGCW